MVQKKYSEFNYNGDKKDLGPLCESRETTKMGFGEVEPKPNNDDVISSEEEDGDEQWKAAINSVASTFIAAPTPSKTTLNPLSTADDDGARPIHSQLPKHYQIKAQKALDDLLEKSLLIVKDPDPVNDLDDDPQVNDGGVRLFKQAPAGIVFDHRDELKGPKRKPRILPGEEIDEKSKKFKQRMKSVVVEGTDILNSAKNACQKSLARYEAKEAAARDTAKREEERVAQLKKIRGEKWLPSIAKEMGIKPRGSLIGSK